MFQSPSRIPFRSPNVVQRCPTFHTWIVPIFMGPQWRVPLGPNQHVLRSSCAAAAQLRSTSAFGGEVKGENTIPPEITRCRSTKTTRKSVAGDEFRVRRRVQQKVRRPTRAPNRVGMVNGHPESPSNLFSSGPFIDTR